MVDNDQLSNCCGASMAGEPSNNFTNTTLEGRCSDCKEMAEFGNQASEDELIKALFKKLPNGWYYHVNVEGVPQASIHKDAVDSMLNTIQLIIRTEKLKLLAEVRERVVGEDEVEDIDLSKSAKSRWGVRARNRVRDEHRELLAKLEAEL